MSATLTLNDRYTNGFAIQLANSDGAGIAFVFEINRSPDFASDDTLTGVVTGVPLGNSVVTILGLPSSTPFYIRAISSNIGAVYSNVLFAATTLVAPITNYAGFSVDKAMLVVPADIANLEASFAAGNALRAGFPVSNLLRDDPQSTFQSVGAVSFTLTFETSGEPIDTVALLGTMADDDATWAISSSPVEGNFAAAGATNSGFITFRCSPSIGRRPSYHGLYTLPAPVTNRFWSISIANAAGPTRNSA